MSEIPKWLQLGLEVYLVNYVNYERDTDEVAKNQEMNFSWGFNRAANLLLPELVAARDALRKINQEELNSQRPGGGHSRSATISYEALVRIDEVLK